MRAFITSSVALSLTITSACTPVLKEVRYTGGYPGYLLDKRTFDASGNKQLFLLRSTLILAMAADMGRSTVSGQDSDGFAQLLASASQEINYAAADLYGTPCFAGDYVSPANDDAGCMGFYENFEANLPQIESRIIKVMLAALPTDKARKFLDEVAKGNVLGAAWNALGAVASTAGGLHVAFARYRSGLETVAGSLQNCAHGGGSFSASTGTVIEAANCLGLSQDDLFENPNEASRSQLRTAKISKRAFFMLMRGIAADCVSLDFSGKGDDLAGSQATRAKACNSIGFRPEARPFRIQGTSFKPFAADSSAPAEPDGRIRTPVPAATGASAAPPAPATAAMPAPAAT